ncbi:metalloregulator ArsR/SmtB family transcription factor [Erysipelothrix rhusiopathiae]|nr:metalloregulator ArsR/SmtB family transcription factor [Erysipelothrix rhusiopathiae]MDE8197335.1 metalloregulator ArsR/SmtB family transcription factor [Erysipelothrix rhusiopathiae]MDE8220876.1 metalloregulator ArsR/SmtB family transcription factor [Erysipelothrix rhusiopathiae]
MLKKNDYSYIFKVLSDDTRLKIIEMLSTEELCACHILEDFDITQPTLSYHMKMLVESGLVSSKKDGNWTRYSLNDQVFEDLQDFFRIKKPKKRTVNQIENC